MGDTRPAPTGQSRLAVECQQVVDTPDVTRGRAPLAVSRLDSRREEPSPVPTSQRTADASRAAEARGGRRVGPERVLGGPCGGCRQADHPQVARERQVRRAAVGPQERAPRPRPPHRAGRLGQGRRGEVFDAARPVRPRARDGGARPRLRQGRRPQRPAPPRRRRPHDRGANDTATLRTASCTNVTRRTHHCNCANRTTVL